MNAVPEMTDDALLKLIAAGLAGLRLARNLTQQHLAEQAGLGLPTLQRLEVDWHQRDCPDSSMLTGPGVGWVLCDVDAGHGGSASECINTRKDATPDRCIGSVAPVHRPLRV